MYKLEVWDWKVACTFFFQRMVQRIQPYILLLSLVTALWLLFYLRFVYEVNFYVTVYWTVLLQSFLPYTQWPLRIEDVVVAYCSWSLTRYWVTTHLFWEELRTHSYFWKRIISCNFKHTSTCNLVHAIYVQERQWSGHASSVCLQTMNTLISCIWTVGWRNEGREDLHSWIQIHVE